MTHYHKYKPIGETLDGLVEVCVECKKKLVTKKDKAGRIDSNKYLKEHVADFAQPIGTTSRVFKQVYGKK